MIFPDGSDLRVVSSANKAMYKPGDQASLTVKVASADGKPVPAALGIAVVDEAVLERERTDQEFGERRPWFQCAYCPDEGEAEIGGVRLNDLYQRKQIGPVPADLDLVAEALEARTGVSQANEAGELAANPPGFETIRKQRVQIEIVLDQHYARTLDFPENAEQFESILGRIWNSLNDPWGMPYKLQFGVERGNRFVTLLSAGPDKRFSTEDDFVAGTFRRSYFEPVASMIRSALKTQDDYPASETEFAKVLTNNGLLIESLRDPWGTPYRARVTTQGASRLIRIWSAGPDRRFETLDDFSLADFRGPYFQREAAAISAAIRNAAQPPKSMEEFRAALATAGINLGNYKDAWGRSYRLISAVSSRYGDRIDSKTVQIFGQAATPKTDVVPVTQKFITFSLRSDGADGIAGTYDDFDVARFPVLLDEKSAQTALKTSEQIAANVRGTGDIFGTVSDLTGGVIPNATVTLTDIAQTSHDTITGAADSVTTWKLAVFASTIDGRSAEHESDLRTFQPFFIDFNPPQVLTQGDEVDLPVAVRNYTGRAEKVSVSLQPNSWSDVTGQRSRQINVQANSSMEADYRIRAKIATANTTERVMARGARTADAIAKTLRVHPDGQKTVRNFSDLASANTTFAVLIPSNAIPGATRAELKFYPNIASLLLESAASLLESPHGCAEQTISTGYANLIAWRFARAAGVVDPAIQKRALDNVRTAVDALGSFMSYDGGVRYWPSGDVDTAVTAYALNFLIDAADAVQVDRDDMGNLASWLEGHQATDGTWTPPTFGQKPSTQQTLMLTGTAARALAAAQKAGLKVRDGVLATAYHHIAAFTDQVDEPYALANFVLSALDSVTKNYWAMR